jgi:hypothetical protein
MNTIAAGVHDPANDPHVVRIAALLTGIGALGVIATSACYAVAGPEAALPGSTASAEAARAATTAAAGWMRAASLFGMPSDVVFTVGGLMLAATRRGTGAGLAIAGWLALAIAGVLFTIVDAMVGFVLPPLAALAGGEAGYVAVRTLFDVLFAIGGWTVGVGAIAVAWSSHWPEYRWRSVLWLMRAAGVIGIAANTSYFFGVPAAALIGPGVALASVALLALAACAYANTQRPTAGVPRSATLPAR